jgi:hypothetical protein
MSVFSARVYLGIPAQSSIFFRSPWYLTNFGISAQPSQQYFFNRQTLRYPHWSQKNSTVFPRTQRLGAIFATAENSSDFVQKN